MLNFGSVSMRCFYIACFYKVFFREAAWQSGAHLRTIYGRYHGKARAADLDYLARSPTQTRLALAEPMNTDLADAARPLSATQYMYMYASYVSFALWTSSLTSLVHEGESEGQEQPASPQRESFLTIRISRHATYNWRRRSSVLLCFSVRRCRESTAAAAA